MVNSLQGSAEISIKKKFTWFTRARYTAISDLTSGIHHRDSAIISKMLLTLHPFTKKFTLNPWVKVVGWKKEKSVGYDLQDIEQVILVGALDMKLVMSGSMKFFLGAAYQSVENKLDPRVNYGLTTVYVQYLLHGKVKSLGMGARLGYRYHQQDFANQSSTVKNSKNQEVYFDSYIIY